MSKAFSLVNALYNNMRKLSFILAWSFLGSAGIIALCKYMQPATFSKEAFSATLCIAFISLFLAIVNKRYE